MDSSHFSPLYIQAMHGIAKALNLDADQLLSTGCVEAEGFRFYFQQHGSGDDVHLGVLAEVEDISGPSEAQTLRRLLEANAHLSPQAGAYALVPGSSHAALRMSVSLADGASSAERIVQLLDRHITDCLEARRNKGRPGARAAGGLIEAGMA